MDAFWQFIDQLIPHFLSRRPELLTPSRILDGVRSHGADRLIRSADAARDARHWALAARLYANALVVAPKRADIWIQYGHALKEIGRFKKAERAYRKALALGLDTSDTHLQLGHVLKLQSRLEDATNSYSTAVRRDPNNAWALGELSAAGYTRNDFKKLLADTLPATSEALGVRQPGAIVFDVSDLLNFVLYARRPTGIQRLQLNVCACLLEPAQTQSAIFAAFSRSSTWWVEIPHQDIQRICTLMKLAGDPSEDRWRSLVARLQVLLLVGEPLKFPDQARLINLGSSWAIGNYFLALSQAKAQHGLTFVPFVHDCIPLLFPQYFDRELVSDFKAWLYDIARHADGFLTNSKSTARDLTAAMADCGRHGIGVSVVELDGVFEASTADGAVDGQALLAHNKLVPRDYVLFVSSIEPRKNHLMAFRAWAHLIATRGAANVPPLVCVGGRGWKNREVFQMLSENRALNDNVRILSNTSDVELVELYRNCRFTLYPSSYEGWGLPVTESLANGKVALAARNSSLVEAGRDLAIYFDGSEVDLCTTLNRLFDDTAELQERERRIAQDFRPRRWSDIAEHILQQATAIARSDALPKPMALPYARFLSFAKVARSRPALSADGFRSGLGWQEPDAHGCKISSEADAELHLNLPASWGRDGDDIRLTLRITSGAAPPQEGLEPPDDGRTHHLVARIDGNDIAEACLHAHDPKWVLVSIPFALRDRPIALRVLGPDGTRRARSETSIEAVFACSAGDHAARLQFVEGVLLGAHQFSPCRLSSTETQLSALL